MRKNEFGELEKKFNKVNILIIIIALAAVMITGVLYARNLTVRGTEAIYLESSNSLSWIFLEQWEERRILYVDLYTNEAEVILGGLLPGRADELLT